MLSSNSVPSSSSVPPVSTAPHFSNLAAPIRFVAAIVIALLACYFAEQIAFSKAVHYPALWAASGVAFAFAWRYGWLWSFTAAFGASIWVYANFFGGLGSLAIPTKGLASNTDLSWSGPLLGLMVGAFLSTAFGPIAAVFALKKMNAWKPAEYRLQAVLRFVLIVALVAAPIDALIAAIAFAKNPLLTISAIKDATAPISAIHVFSAWWVIDALGIVLIGPALLAILNEALAEQEPGVIDTIVDWSAIFLNAGVATVSLVVGLLGHSVYALASLFFFFPIVAWTSIRMSERATALTLFVCSIGILFTYSLQIGSGSAALESAYVVSSIVFAGVVVALVLQAVAADRRFALARVARQARQDMSTGLLNDRGLVNELTEVLMATNRSNYGLIGVHLNNFDTLNDLCGAIQGLQLEQITASLLQQQPHNKMAARLSAGRYALLIEANTVAQVRTAAREVYSQLSGQVFKTENGSVRLQVSVGGLLVEKTAVVNAEDCILSLSDAVAIAASVRDPQLFVEPLSQTMIETRRAHQGKIEHIKEAIREQRFDLHAQPIIDPDAPEGSLSYEILIRLRDRDNSLIRPPEFMPLAVQAQITPAMDRSVIARCFEWLAGNPEALEKTFKCSINLSGMTMSDGTIAGYIREQRALYNIPSNKIVFEITESEAIRSPSAASRLVDVLKADGFGIALDDFGTGLATFEYLKRFPLDYLKIDGSFIKNLMTNPIDEEIVLSTIRVAKRLNIKTIAEHVHNKAIFDRLKILGVEHIQGEYRGMPQPIDTLFQEFLEVRSVNSTLPFRSAWAEDLSKVTSL
jgi:EAL domain-containing protein (putative c-di-GMP-specific phosphodiesterase class I)/GGDEF domain-containing protein